MYCSCVTRYTLYDTRFMMKRVKKLLQAIHALPEEARRLLAGLSFIIIAALMVFSSWNMLISSRLTSLSGETVGPAASGRASPNKIGRALTPSFPSTEYAPAKSEALSPLEGVTESFRSLQSVIGPKGKDYGGLATVPTFFGKVWRYVYEPLK